MTQFKECLNNTVYVMFRKVKKRPKSLFDSVMRVFEFHQPSRQKIALDSHFGKSGAISFK